MSGLYYSSGQLAHELGVSPSQVRALCASGGIQAQTTPGGQYRVPKSELERLRRDGLPTVPRPMPADNPRLSPAKARYGHPALLAEPSEEVVSAAEDVAVTENLLKKRKLERELEETEDWFRERERQQEEQKAAEEEEERLRLAEEEAQRERVEWLQSWEQYALASLPSDLPPEMRLEAHRAVRSRLEGLDPIPLKDVTRRLVDSEVQKVGQAWVRRKETQEAVEEARKSLPSELKGSLWTPSEYEIRAREAAAAAIRGLRPEASYEVKRMAAIQAAKGIVAEHEAQKAVRQDAEMRESVIRCTSLPVGLTDEVKEIALRAVAEELAKLPQGTPRHRLEKVREEVLAPLRTAVAQRQQADAQRAAEERRKEEDQAARRGIVTYAPWQLPWDFPAEQREPALAAVSKAIGELPEGTPRQQLEQACDQALQPFLDAHARRKHKEQLIEDSLRGIFAYMRKLEQDWDFEGKTAWTLESEIRGPIRDQLDNELTGEEPPEQVTKCVHRLVREKLGIERRVVHVQKAS